MRAYLLVALTVFAGLSASDDDDDRRPSPGALRQAPALIKMFEDAVDATSSRSRIYEEKVRAKPDLPHDQCVTQNCGAFSRIGTRSNSDQKYWWVMEDLNEEFDCMCWHRVETWVLGLLLSALARGVLRLRLHLLLEHVVPRRHGDLFYLRTS